MAKKLITLTTFSDLLKVNENSGFTAIGIKAPSDSQYPASKLTVMVTGLPTDGTVFLSDGVTRVFVGERLTVTQLTSLLFQPTNGLFGTSSSFTYSVTDPSGTKATGSATLTIGPDIMPPVTTAAMLSVAANSGPTLIGIAAPTDPNYGTSQLTVTVSALPGGGLILLADGVTQVTLGEKLTVGQLTGLMFEPNADTFNASFTFSYKVTDPAGLSATGSATVAIAADSQPPITTDPTLTVAPNSGPIAAFHAKCSPHGNHSARVRR